MVCDQILAVFEMSVQFFVLRANVLRRLKHFLSPFPPFAQDFQQEVATAIEAAHGGDTAALAAAAEARPHR